MSVFTRRQLILLSLAAPLVPMMSGCRGSLPTRPSADSSREALSLLKRSAAAHGLAAYAAINDLNVSYAGHWRRLVRVLQPALVDSGFRGGSEERLLIHEGVIAQSHTGPAGHKQVVRSYSTGNSGSVRVWFNGEEAQDKDRVDSAALVADAYALFLLGPMLLVVNQAPYREIEAALAGTAEIMAGKYTRVCDVLDLKVTPGFGNSESDRLALYIDRDSQLMLRARMTLNGLESTRGALVDIDTSEHQSMHGILWPTTFHERLLRPAPLDVHHWKLTGLDINRGESQAELSGPAFIDKASIPATPLAHSRPAGNA